MFNHDDIGSLLHHTAFVLARQSDQVLSERLGIGFAQFKILLLLQQATALSQKSLAEALGQTEASVSRQIKILTDSGLVQVSLNPRSRRENMVGLTTKGMALSENCSQSLNNYYAPMFSKLSDRQRQQLYELLGDLHKSVCDNH